MSRTVKVIAFLALGFTVLQGLSSCASISEGYPDLHDLKRKDKDIVFPELKEQEMKDLQREKEEHKEQAIKEIKSNQ